MNKMKWLLLIISVFVLGGCSSFSNNPQHPSKLERVGVLLVQDCTGDTDCDRFSLLEPDMQSRSVALNGRINESLGGRLIAVLGVGAEGQNALELVKVEQTRAITDFDYKPFMDKAVANYIQKKYSCTSLWDQNYAWRLDGRQPLFIATLSNPLAADAGTVKLEFDGLTKAMLSVSAVPESANPCQLR